MHGLSTIICLASLAIAWVGALPVFPSYLQNNGPTRLEKDLAEIDAMGHRENDFGQLMLESGEENDMLSSLLFTQQTGKLGRSQGRLRERRVKKSKEKHHRHSKERKKGKSKEKKLRKSKEKKHRRKSHEKCGGRGRSKERHPCTTSFTTTTADATTVSTTPETTTMTTTMETTLTSQATTSATTPAIPMFTEPFESSDEVETLIPFSPAGIDDGFFPYILLGESESVN